jgi:hypothetical protein
MLGLAAGGAAVAAAIAAHVGGLLAKILEILSFLKYFCNPFKDQ